jgi:hypothetical protein
MILSHESMYADSQSTTSRNIYCLCTMPLYTSMLLNHSPTLMNGIKKKKDEMYEMQYLNTCPSKTVLQYFTLPPLIRADSARTLRLRGLSEDCPSCPSQVRGLSEWSARTILKLI